METEKIREIDNTYNMNKELLICISSRNPSDILLTNIFNLKKFYPDAKIIVVDSDSTQLDIYTIIEDKYKDIDIIYAKNKNFEYGAYKTGYSLYSDYNIYMCIQDSLINTVPVDINLINDNNSNIYFHNSGFNSHLETIDIAKTLIVDTDMKKLFEKLAKDNFTLATHCSFIVTNNILKNIFEVLPIPPVDKIGSCTYERLFGLYFIYKNINTNNMETHFNKINMHRDY